MRSRSERLGNLTQSDIRRMTRECERVGGINLGQGICDLPTPLPVVDGATAAIRDGRATYSPFEGVLPLREAIAAELARDGLEVDPQREIVVSVGSTGCLAAALVALFDPGDELILLEPYYGYHRAQAALLGLTVTSVPLEPGSWRLDPERLEAAIGPRTRGIVVNTPGNPSGTVFGADELDALARICRDHDLLAVTDEIYEKILYDGRRHLRLATREGMRERTVTISGFSKTYSITGWRLGWLMAPPEIAHAVGLASDVLAVCAPTPLQWGVVAGLAELPADFYAGLARDYQVKRDRIVAALGAAGLPARSPEGAYYVLADVSETGLGGSREAADALLAETGVAAVAGTSFFASETGERYLRFCFAKDDEPLAEACRRLEGWRVAAR